jgi:hypothetical protein
MMKTRRVVYLDPDTQAWTESLRQTITDEELFFAAGMSDASFLRLVIRAGLQSLTAQTRAIQEA